MFSKRILDWAMGELLAWYTLYEGYNVRLSGQDVEEEPSLIVMLLCRIWEEEYFNLLVQNFKGNSWYNSLISEYLFGFDYG